MGKQKKLEKKQFKEIDLIIGRLNIVQFYKLTEEEQEKLKKSCANKVRHPNLQ